jgi:hypothetical protein
LKDLFNKADRNHINLKNSVEQTNALVKNLPKHAPPQPTYAPVTTNANNNNPSELHSLLKKHQAEVSSAMDMHADRLSMIGKLMLETL